jgi:APA family basic amino acid/polyamine antiporter
VAIVVANMVGTGVFTSLGFQLLDLRSGFVILLLWVVGGITALCGALSYAELGAALPRSGGEYRYLRDIYHPCLGFISGWISLTIGFAAPTALAAVTFGAYLAAAIPGVPQTVCACMLIAALAVAHTRSRSSSGFVQQSFTAVKVLVILLFCLLVVAFMKAPTDISLLPAANDQDAIFSSAFAVALIYVNYAYTGWNAATYLSGELNDPARTLPRALALGTATVLVLYIALNTAFLVSTPADALAGKVEIGYLVAEHVFGPTAGAAMGGVLALLLISTVSAMILAGPRVLHAIGGDFPAFRRLAGTNGDGLPVTAIYAQAVLSIALILSATFESILVFSSFILGINTLLTVAGVFVLRARKPDLPRPFRIPGYPLPPLIFIALMSWTLVHVLMQRPVEGWLGLGLIALGGLLYAAFGRSADTP